MCVEAALYQPCESHREVVCVVRAKAGYRLVCKNVCSLSCELKGPQGRSCESVFKKGGRTGGFEWDGSIERRWQHGQGSN